MSRFELLRDTWSELDRVWLANCKIVNQTLFYYFGYFGKRLPSTLSLLAGADKGLIVTVKLHPSLVNRESAVVIYDRNMLDLDIIELDNRLNKLN